MKEAILKLKAELEKIAQEKEKQTQEKCAQVLLAASGLDLLKNKLGLNDSESR